VEEKLLAALLLGFGHRIAIDDGAAVVVVVASV
jgi:hypothetical protein